MNTTASNKKAGEAWTAEDEAYLTANFATVPNRELARRMGRTYEAIRCRGQVMKLKKVRNVRDRAVYQRKEVPKKYIQYVPWLMEHYGKVPVQEVAAHMGISMDNTCTTFVSALRRAGYAIPRGDFKRKDTGWMDAILVYVKENFSKKSRQEICAHLNITNRTLSTYLSHWRAKGEVFIKPSPYPIGTIRKTEKRGCVLQEIRTERGWAYYKSTTINPKPRQPKPRKERPSRAKVFSRVLPKEPKPQPARKILEDAKFIKSMLGEKVIKIKPRTEGKVLVKLDTRTSVYAEPGYNIEELRSKYLRKTA
ncbi:MAG: hypothetical protein EOP56_09230 [Sphingobacteriales bacterium]|nr:MAG: hypothetical protein EOP56_09230 [Sphingobacteriales bacterium]